MKRYLISTILSLLALFSTAGAVHAQMPRHFTPARPIISPYFGYGAVNVTGLPNYYTYVLPLQRQAEYAIQAGQAQRTPSTYAVGRETLNDQTIGDILDRHLTQRLTTGQGAPVEAASFQNYSHYYRMTAPGARR